MRRERLTLKESLEAGEKAVALLRDRDAEGLAVLAARRRARLKEWRRWCFPPEVVRMGMIMLAAAERARVVAMMREMNERD